VLPLLPPAATAATVTDDVVDAVLDFVTVLNRDFDPSLDLGSCAEVLYEVQQEGAAAKKFMRVAYTALCSAARQQNPAAAVGVVKRYLQKGP
jgi:hypothetical protein